MTSTGRIYMMRRMLAHEHDAGSGEAVVLHWQPEQAMLKIKMAFGSSRDYPLCLYGPTRRLTVDRDGSQTHDAAENSGSHAGNQSTGHALKIKQ